MARYGKKAQEKVREAICKSKRGQLKSGGNGKTVKIHVRQLLLACQKREKGRVGSTAAIQIVDLPARTGCSMLEAAHTEKGGCHGIWSRIQQSN